MRLRDWVWCPLLIAAGILGTGLAVAAPADSAVVYAVDNTERVCNTLDQFPTVVGVEGVVLAIVDEGLTPEAAGQVVGIAVRDECPWHGALLEAFIAKWAGEQIA